MAVADKVVEGKKPFFCPLPTVAHSYSVYGLTEHGDKQCQGWHCSKARPSQRGEITRNVWTSSSISAVGRAVSLGLLIGLSAGVDW